jgi:hypothetical protein
MHRRLIAVLLAAFAPMTTLAAQQAVEYVDTLPSSVEANPVGDGTISPAMRELAPFDTTHSVLIRRMKADLRVLVTKQHKYYVRHRRYADNITLVPFDPVKGGQARIISAGPGGWSAVLTVRGVSCGVFAGLAMAPNAAVVGDEEPGCWFRRRDGVRVGV